jgi:mono/diheme cytochrome c family protein
MNSDIHQPSRKMRIGYYLPLIAFFLSMFSLAQAPQSPPLALIHDGQIVYASNCSGCHGADTLGTDRAPKLTGNPDVRRRTSDQLRNLIKSGIPSGGMPAFETLPPQQIDAITAYIHIDTGDVAWEIEQRGPVILKTWSGVLGTAGGVVFYGDPNGAFVAVDERNGKTLWHFNTNVGMKASPMTFAVDGKQFVAVAAGSVFLCFGLPSS